MSSFCDAPIMVRYGPLAAAIVRSDDTSSTGFGDAAINAANSE
jgi:hypothetical protein